MSCTAAVQTADVAAPPRPDCTRDEGELAEDWLAALVRGTLLAAAGATEPPQTTWAVIQRRLKDHSSGT